ncbi:MAG: hypothetical protein HFF18_12240 [Oscillospiraceae bacterium]|nr:hypothetical protein [Oscillospiraceae bacterium]
MDPLYQRTFDQVRMSEEQVRQIRAGLASRCPRDEMEAHLMNNSKRIRRPILAIAAVFLIAAMSLTAFAYGGKIVEGVYTLMTGAIIEHGVDENGNSYASGSVETGDVTDPVELREDGRLYLTANGEDLDITDLCSYEIPYIYECTGPDGLRHAFIIGGGLDAIGWAEFMWDEEGMPEAGRACFGTPGGTDDAPWLDAGKAQLDLPW